MNRYYYKKSRILSAKKFGRVVGLTMTFIGVCIVGYIFFPLLVWQITLAPLFASQGVNAPIPKSTIVSTHTLTSLLATSVTSLGKNYDNVNSWFPNVQFHQGMYTVSDYTISIPSIGVTDAHISTTDTDLAKHMVHLGGSALPPDKGTAIVFGHSTLPQLFDPNNYHTILANAYRVKVGDTLLITVNHVTYTYKVYALRIVNPDDTSVLIQQFDDRYFTLITCTPPGTVWQRLAIQTKLEKI